MTFRRRKIHGDFAMTGIAIADVGIQQMTKDDDDDDDDDDDG